MVRLVTFSFSGNLPVEYFLIYGMGLYMKSMTSTPCDFPVGTFFIVIVFIVTEHRWMAIIPTSLFINYNAN